MPTAKLTCLLTGPFRCHRSSTADALTLHSVVSGQCLLGNSASTFFIPSIPFSCRNIFTNILSSFDNILQILCAYVYCKQTLTSRPCNRKTVYCQQAYRTPDHGRLHCINVGANAPEKFQGEVFYQRQGEVFIFYLSICYYVCYVTLYAVHGRKVAYDNKKDGYRQLNVRQLGNLRPWDHQVNVTWIEREFNACQTPRSMYPSIFNHF